MGGLSDHIVALATDEEIADFRRFAQCLLQ